MTENDPISKSAASTPAWEKFIKIIASLRAPDGCPWDREQTERSLIPFAIEETFELAEAIESGQDGAIVEELGDVLLQVVLHAQIASETARFTIDDVVRGISEKMVRRHPHVFGDESEKVSTSSEVLTRWQEIKKAEKAGRDTAKPPQDFRFDVPLAMPALSRAAKIGEKTARLKFDWPSWKGAFEKVEEELGEVKAAMNDNREATYKPKEGPETGPSYDPVASEIGDLLFSVAQLARHRGLDPEQCLRETNARFERRFGILQDLVKKRELTDGRNWESRAQDELEELWGQAKTEEIKNR